MINQFTVFVAVAVLPATFAAIVALIQIHRFYVWRNDVSVKLAEILRAVQATGKAKK
jgi:hypothetical protein